MSQCQFGVVGLVKKDHVVYVHPLEGPPLCFQDHGSVCSGDLVSFLSEQKHFALESSKDRVGQLVAMNDKQFVVLVHEISYQVPRPANANLFQQYQHVKFRVEARPKETMVCIMEATPPVTHSGWLRRKEGEAFWIEEDVTKKWWKAPFHLSPKFQQDLHSLVFFRKESDFAVDLTPYAHVGVVVRAAHVYELRSFWSNMCFSGTSDCRFQTGDRVSFSLTFHRRTNQVCANNLKLYSKRKELEEGEIDETPFKKQKVDISVAIAHTKQSYCSLMAKKLLSLTKAEETKELDAQMEHIQTTVQQIEKALQQPVQITTSHPELATALAIAYDHRRSLLLDKLMVIDDVSKMKQVQAQLDVLEKTIQEAQQL